MTSDNDNRPPVEASRLLPILGQVGRDGRVTMTGFAKLSEGRDGDVPPEFPNDPREA
jgi:hypothetical protein